MNKTSFQFHRNILSMKVVMKVEIYICIAYYLGGVYNKFVINFLVWFYFTCL